MFWKKNNETNKQEKKISLNSKKDLLDTLHGKTFKAKQWLKTQLKLKQNERIWCLLSLA